MKNSFKRFLIAFMTMASIIMVVVCPKMSLAAPTLKSQVIRLFKESGGAVSDYNKQIANIIHAAKNNQLPIIVQFSKGVSYKVFAVHGGNQNLILDVGDKVLRIRSTTYRPFYFWNSILSPSSMIDSLSNYVRGHETLAEQKIPIPELTIIPGHEKEFLVLEKINIEFSYADYVNPKFIAQIRLRDLLIIDSNFLKFAEKTYEFRNFGDFGGNQLVYSLSRGWVLIDFSNTHELHTGTGGNVFEYDKYDHITNVDGVTSNMQREIINKPGLPARIRNQTLRVINAARSGKSSSVSRCELLFL